MSVCPSEMVQACPVEQQSRMIGYVSLFFLGKSVRYDKTNGHKGFLKCSKCVCS